MHWHTEEGTADVPRRMCNATVGLISTYAIHIRTVTLDRHHLLFVNNNDAYTLEHSGPDDGSTLGRMQRDNSPQIHLCLLWEEHCW